MSQPFRFSHLKTERKQYWLWTPVILSYPWSWGKKTLSLNGLNGSINIRCPFKWFQVHINRTSNGTTSYVRRKLQLCRVMGQLKSTRPLQESVDVKAGPKHYSNKQAILFLADAKSCFNTSVVLGWKILPIDSQLIILCQHWQLSLMLVIQWYHF